MTIFRETKLAALMTSAALVGTLCEPAYAQDTGQENENTVQDDGSVFGGIIVTATKREQDLQDVGISITAFGGEQIEALGYTHAGQITALAPGVSTVQPNGESNYALAIRGASNSDFNTNIEGPVALYVDEVYISQSSGSGFALFDLERVEILRGPQGTLFGRNATGGLAHFITNRPEFDFGGYVRASYGSFQTLSVEGALNVPLTDTLAARISISTQQGDGYATNRLRPDDRLNNSNEYAGRVQLLYEPSNSFSALLNVRLGSQDIRTGFFESVSAPLPNGVPQPTVPNAVLGGYIDTDGDVFAGDYDIQGVNDLETFGASLTANIDLGFGTLTSITDYQSVNRDYIDDTDSSPVEYLHFFLTTDAEQFSQELRIAGESGDVNWVAGLYYLNISFDDSNGSIAPGFLNDLFTLVDPTLIGLGNGFVSPYSQTTNSYSAFAQVNWELNDQFALTLGGRYIIDRKNYSYANQLVNFPDTAVRGTDPNRQLVFDLVTPFADTRKDNLWSARAQIDFTPTDNLLTYISYNRGVRGGGFNAPTLPTPQLVTPQFMNYDPEVVNAFEGGFKWTLPDGFGRFNASAYYYNYSNFQAFSFVGVDAFTLNASSENYGFEAELFLNPAQGLDFLFSVGHINAQVDDIIGITTQAPIAGAPPPVLPAGQSAIPVQTPKWNLGGLARYEAVISDWNGALNFQADFQYRSRHFFALTQRPGVTENGYAVFNGSVAWVPDDSDWELRVSVDNIFDEEYLVQTYDLSGPLALGGGQGNIIQYYGRPRTWRASVRMNF